MDAYATERNDQRLIFGDPARARSKSRATASERRRESDDEVRNNISPEFVPVFDAVRGRIRDSERRSRTEAFLEWVHDHSADVDEILNRQLTEDLRRLEREERVLVRQFQRKRGSAKAAKVSRFAAAFDEVPF
nr:Hypothetical protein MSR10575_88700 [Sandaracinus sp.]